MVRDSSRMWFALGAVGVCFGAMSMSVASAEEGASWLPQATGAVATVDGKEIPADAFNDKMARVEEAVEHPLPAAVMEAIEKQALDTTIERHLVEVELRDAQLDDKAVAEAKKERAAAKKEALEAPLIAEETSSRWLSEARAEMWTLAEDSRLEAKLDVYLRREYGLEVSDEEVREFFDENRAFLASSEKVNLRKIRMGLGAEDNDAVRERAHKTYEAITDEDTTFFEAAETVSDSQLTDEGGEVGYVRRSGIVEQVADVAFEMDRGEVSKPIETPYAVYIVKVMDRREEREADFEELAPGIERLLTNNQRQQLHRQMIDDLREGAEIEIHWENVE